MASARPEAARTASTGSSSELRYDLSSALGDVLGQYILWTGNRDRSLVVFDWQHVGSIAVTDEVKYAPLLGSRGLELLRGYGSHTADELFRGRPECCS